MNLNHLSFKLERREYLKILAGGTFLWIGLGIPRQLWASQKSKFGKGIQLLVPFLGPCLGPFNSQELELFLEELKTKKTDLYHWLEKPNREWDWKRVKELNQLFFSSERLLTLIGYRVKRKGTWEDIAFDTYTVRPPG